VSDRRSAGAARAELERGNVAVVVSAGELSPQIDDLADARQAPPRLDGVDRPAAALLELAHHERLYARWAHGESFIS
jgi:hypothetical protein